MSYSYKSGPCILAVTHDLLFMTMFRSYTAQPTSTNVLPTRFTTFSFYTQSTCALSPGALYIIIVVEVVWSHCLLGRFWGLPSNVLISYWGWHRCGGRNCDHYWGPHQLLVGSPENFERWLQSLATVGAFVVRVRLKLKTRCPHPLKRGGAVSRASSEQKLH